MRELIVTEMVSLDGVMEAPGGEAGYRNAGWTFNEIKFAPAAFELKGTEQEEAGALLLGRTSYQAFAPVWPQMDDSARSRQGSWVTVMVPFWSTAVELWSRDCRRKGSSTSCTCSSSQFFWARAGACLARLSYPPSI